MTLKGLFEKVSVVKTVANKTADQIGNNVESERFHAADIVNEKRFVPNLNFSHPEEFAQYGSAEQYYLNACKYIYNSYPYDGSLYERLAWRNSGSYLDQHVFDNEYPRTTGYINFSYGGWGAVSSAAQGYGLPASTEYIFIKGGPGLGGGPHTQTANVWEPSQNRKSNLEFNLATGTTLEFWMRKAAYDPTKTQKEVIFDLWNNELTSSAQYGRFRLELTSAAASPWRLTVLSGTTGFQSVSLAQNTVTTASVANDQWQHYAVSLKNTTEGKSVNFDGIDDGIQIGVTDDWNASIGGAGTAAKPYTLSIWVYRDGSSTEVAEDLMSFGYSGGTRRLYITTATGQITLKNAATNWRKSSVNLATGEWYHVVATYAGGIAGASHIYVNGVLADDSTSTAGAPGLLGGDQASTIGKSANLLQYSLGGNLNNASIWKKELSLAEAQEIYNSGVPDDLMGHSAADYLTAWYPLGNGPRDQLDGTNVPSFTNQLPSLVNGAPTAFAISGKIENDQIQAYSPLNNTITAKFYIDGNLNKTQYVSTGLTTLTASAIGPIQGGLVATIGALAAAPSSSAPIASAYSGKLSASLDEFRYWKTQRSSKDIGRYWFTQVGGGTNTDPANTTLGVYYKFNEGITGTTSYDTTILDYSGRVTNGSWTGYSADGSRNTGSAIVESEAATAEFKDPIIYSTHPAVEATITRLGLTGSAHDLNNPAQLLTTFPSWIQEADGQNGNELQKLTQIMSSYLDTLYVQIQQLNEVHAIQYVSGSRKPNTIANRLLEAKGLLVPELFLDADILEQLGDRSESIVYQKSLTDIKNAIYQNIYNNLSSIFKSKGTLRSFRNVLRCFGVDDEIYKINVYGNNIEYRIRNNRELNSVKKTFVDFNHKQRFDSTVFQQTASSNSNSVSYLSASNQLTGGYASTLETYVLFPDKPEVYDEGYSNQEFRYLSASLFGRHTVGRFGVSPNSLTWNTPDNANFQVYAVRNERNSRAARFVLTSSAGGVIPLLSSSYFDDVYSNSNWILAVTLKPSRTREGWNFTGSSPPNYTIEFKGSQVDAGTQINSFSVTASLNPTTVGYGFITGSTRVYVGAHRQDFTGAVLTRTDSRPGFCRYWVDELTATDLLLHGQDVHNYGRQNPSHNAYLFDGPAAQQNTEIKQNQTLALNWDFETVTGSNASGQFTVPDFSSGSVAAQASQYGLLGNLLGAQHTGQGYGFPASSTQVIDPDYVLAAELLNFEQLTSMDMIKVLNRQDDIIFKRDSRPINFKFAIEKSMYQTISENMLKMFSEIVDFNNLVGNPVNKYRREYKDLRILRENFFLRVGNIPDLDHYIEFYKWFDSALTSILQQLVPAGADFSESIRTTIESHILERNKYQHRIPRIVRYPDVFTTTLTSPATTNPGNNNANAPASAGAPPSVETPPEVINLPDPPFHPGGAPSGGGGAPSPESDSPSPDKPGHHSQDTPWKPPHTHPGKDEDKKNVPEAKRKIEYGVRIPYRPYRISARLRTPLSPGSNFSPNKQVGIVFEETRPFGGKVGPTNAPAKVMMAPATGSNIQRFKKRPRYSPTIPTPSPRLGFSLLGAPNESGSSFTSPWGGNGNVGAPFSMYSSSIADFNSSGPRNYELKRDVILTNLHDDLISNDGRKPLQGPFAERFVGGREYRHVEPMATTRQEGWLIRLGYQKVSSSGGGFISGRNIGLLPPNFTSYTAGTGFTENPNTPVGNLWRNVGTKRPVNISNILITTESLGTRLSGTIAHGRIGNYNQNLQVIQAPGRTTNDLFFERTNFSFASYPETLATRGRFPLLTPTTETPNVGGNLDYQLPNRDGPNSNETVMVCLFRSPGSYESVSRGYLEPPHEEKSVYSVLPYRNLRVRDYGYPGTTSGSTSVLPDKSITGSIRVVDQINHQRGLKQLQTLHCGQYGLDAVYGSPTQTRLSASWHKVNMNPRKRIKETGATSYITSSWYDNWYIQHPIPRSTQGYMWVTSSLQRGASIFGYSHLSGGYFIPTLPVITSSTTPAVEIDESPASGWMSRLETNFDNLNLLLYDPITSSINTLGYPLTKNLTAYRILARDEKLKRRVRIGDIFHHLMLMRNGPYQWPSWKQMRVAESPVMRHNRKNNLITIVTQTAYDREINSTRGNSFRQYVEPAMYSEEHPIVHRMKVSAFTPEVQQTTNAADASVQYGAANSNVVLTNTYGNKLINFADYDLNSRVPNSSNPAAADLYVNRINNLIFKSNNDSDLGAAISGISLVYRQRVYPAAYNSYLGRTFLRQNFSIDRYWNDRRKLRTSIPIQQGFTTRNSQGQIILSQSAWPLDAHVNFKTVVPILPGINPGASMGDGELQNSYSRYGKAGRNSISGAVTYAWKVPVGSDTYGNLALGGGTEFQLSGTYAGTSDYHTRIPHETYKVYSKNIMLIGKDHSLVPEFRISEHLEEYYETNKEDFFTLDNIDDWFEITGSKYANSSQDGFFRDYANSDFMKFFKFVDTAESAELVDGSVLEKSQFGLMCTALVKPLPYEGFFPAEYALKLGTLFSKSITDDVALNGTDADGKETSYRATWRAFLEPWTSLLLNSVKSGIAVGSHICTAHERAGKLYDISKPRASASANCRNTTFPEGIVNYGSSSLLSASSNRSDNFYNFQRVPFEALYRPAIGFSANVVSGSSSTKGSFYDNGLASASLSQSAGTTSQLNKVRWSGQASPLYNLAIDNFLASSMYWFIDESQRPVFRSKPEGQFKEDVIAGQHYAMTFNLRRTLGKDLRADRTNFEMYNRATAFGAPFVLDSGSAQTTSAVSSSGYIDLTSSIAIAGKAASGYILLTASRGPGVKANGYVRIWSYADNVAGQRMYFTGSSGTVYTFILSDGPTAVINEENTEWDVNVGTSNTTQRENLFTAITNSAFVKTGGTCNKGGTEYVQLTQSTAGPDYNYGIEYTFAGASKSGFANGATGSWTGSLNCDAYTISDGGTDGSTTAFDFYLQQQAGLCAEGAEDKMVALITSSAMQTGTNLAAAINAQAAFNVTATATNHEPSTVLNTSRVVVTNGTTGSDGNVAITAVTNSLGYPGLNRFSKVHGMAGGAMARYSLTSGDSFTLRDGGTDGSATTTTFTMKGSPSLGTDFQLLAENAATTATNFINKLHDSATMNISGTVNGSAANARISLTNQGGGSAGNKNIWSSITSASYYASGGMAGGINGTSTIVHSASQAPNLPSYFYGKSSVTILTSASFGAAPTLGDLLSNAKYIYSRDYESDNYHTGAVGYWFAQQLSESYHLNTIRQAKIKGTTDLEVVWEIAPKWECPVLDFSDIASSVTLPPQSATPMAADADRRLTSVGMWHQYGQIPTGHNGVFASIDTPTSVTLAGQTYRAPRSLADLVGFEEGVEKRLGTVREGLRVKEAVIAVPFILASDGRRKFFKLPRSARRAPEIDQHLKTYIFPPLFEKEKVAMYVFEFHVDLTKQDLTDIWQNVLPQKFRDPTASPCTAVFQHDARIQLDPIGAGELINKTTRKLREDLRWLVFRVKQRAQSNFESFREQYTTELIDDPCEPQLITETDTRSRSRNKYTYNWPYDWLSLVELVKIDESITYTGRGGDCDDAPPSAPPSPTAASAAPQNIPTAPAVPTSNFTATAAALPGLGSSPLIDPDWFGDE